MNSRTCLFLILALNVTIVLQVTHWSIAEAPHTKELNSTRDRNTLTAKGDGKVDATDALQYMFNKAKGEVVLPAGQYRITKPIIVNLDKIGPTSIIGSGSTRIIMSGPGPAFRIVGTHRGTADPKTVSAAVWKQQRMPVVAGMEIIGEHPEADGIEATGTMMLTINKVLVRNARHGIHLPEHNRNVIISDCHLYKNSGAGLFLDSINLHQINVNNCHISYNGGGGIVVRDSAVCNLQITGCDIEANMSPNGPPAANIWVDTANGPRATAEITIVGCTIQHTHSAPDSANIRIHGTDRDKRVGPDHVWGNITIGDNVISDAQYNIDIRNARGICITGNTFWRGYERNLQIETSTNIVVGTNNFDRNPRYYWGGPAEKNGILIRQCNDLTLNGLHLNDVRQKQAALILQNCNRVNMTNCTILDCDNGGLLLENVSHSRVSDCLIRFDKQSELDWLALKVTGGKCNQIADNLLSNKPIISSPATQADGNVIQP